MSHLTAIIFFKKIYFFLSFFLLKSLASSNVAHSYGLTRISFLVTSVLAPMMELSKRNDEEPVSIAELFLRLSGGGSGSWARGSNDQAEAEEDLSLGLGSNEEHRGERKMQIVT